MVTFKKDLGWNKTKSIHTLPPPWRRNHRSAILGVKTWSVCSMKQDKHSSPSRWYKTM